VSPRPVFPLTPGLGTTTQQRPGCRCRSRRSGRQSAFFVCVCVTPRTRRKGAGGQVPQCIRGSTVFFSIWLDLFSINSSTTDPVAVGRFCTICTFLEFRHPSTKSLAHHCAAMQRFNVPYDFGKPLPWHSPGTMSQTAQKYVHEKPSKRIWGGNGQ
jgi:hypothetical protein